jgi:hypothetical protein
VATKPGLYANINAKRARIKAGSGEKMRKVGAKGAPTAKAFKQSLKTAKKKKLKKVKKLLLVITNLRRLPFILQRVMQLWLK